MNERMSKNAKGQSLVLPFVIGVVLGIIAKLVDVPYVTSYFPIFDDAMARFGIWVWIAALIAILSKSPLFAAARSFAFFAGMLAAYYGYTVLFLKFFPKSQIILWSCIALITPFCGFFIWHVQEDKWFADLIGSLPFVLFFTEWYLTAADDRLLLFVYLCMIFSLSAVIPTNRKRFFCLLYGLLASMILIWMMQTGIIINIYDQLLNI